MNAAPANPVVHLELHTSDRTGAGGFYRDLFGWNAERIETGGRAYHSVELAHEFGGGIVECGTPRPLWLPYVEVERVGEATECATRLGASVLLPPREGPAGWRSVVSSPVAGEVAFWQPKACS